MSEPVQAKEAAAEAKAATTTTATKNKDKDKDYEALFEQHCAKGIKAKAEYEELVQKMVNRLSPEVLEPFAKVLRENHCILKDPEALIDSVRRRLLRDLLRITDRFWSEFDVTTSIASLEMLKENFQNRKCEASQKTPEERIRPIRARYLLSRANLFQKDIDQKTVRLQDLVSKVQENRSLIQRISKQRVFLQQEMSKGAERFKLIQQWMEDTKIIERCLSVDFAEKVSAKDILEESVNTPCFF